MQARTDDGSFTATYLVAAAKHNGNQRLGIRKRSRLSASELRDHRFPELEMRAVSNPAKTVPSGFVPSMLASRPFSQIRSSENGRFKDQAINFETALPWQVEMLGHAA